MDYRIRRDDGEELHAEVRCWERAHAPLPNEQRTQRRACGDGGNRGSAAALEYAELVESPATRGAVLISIWSDLSDEGNMRRLVSYERVTQ